MVTIESPPQETAPSPGPTPRKRRKFGRITGAHSWRGAAATLVLIFGISLSSLLIGITLTPSQAVDTLGQHFTVSAVKPSFSLQGHGEVTINKGRPETFNLLPTHYFGLLRAHLSVDAPFQGSEEFKQAAAEQRLPAGSSQAFTRGFHSWLIMFVAITIGTAVALTGLICFILLLATGEGRSVLWLGLRSLVATGLSLVLTVILFTNGSGAIANAKSFDGLVGHSTLHLSPQPVGPKLKGYDAVSIGDSRAATQGTKNIAHPTKEEVACQQSSDSLAAQIGRLMAWRVLNKACSAATIAEGLMGQQCRARDSHTQACTLWIPAQMGVVKQMTNLRAVFVTIGPNDVWWAVGLGLCYLADVCNDNITAPNYEALMERFKWNLYDLLVELQGLHNGPGGSRPLIVINGSYDALDESATCPDAKGLTKEKISLLNQRNADLNRALEQGARLFGFRFIKPHLKKLCEDLADSPGPEIRGRTEHDAFHPTGNGVATIATADAVEVSRAA